LTVRSASNPKHADTAVDPDDKDEDADGFDEVVVVTTQPKKRGRPPGSKNKPKTSKK